MIAFFRRLLSPRKADLPPPPAGWDGHQATVIAAPATARLLVDGGPGTGKTAVACARIAHLVETGLAPSRIRVVSFTRTAIREVRERLAASGAQDVTVATLDALAWTLQPEVEMDGSYDQSIARVLDSLRTGGEAARALAEIGHLVIDEAHDIVGLRADLVAAIIAGLPANAGITVFADEAQAIYGFAERGGGWSDDRLLGRLRALPGFTEIQLETVFRARSAALARLFGKTRRHVLACENDPGILARVRRDIRACADGRIGGITRLPAGDGDNTLVLFRRRIEVLEASDRLHRAGIRHRLRMSGLPVCRAPWIAAALGGHIGPILSRDTFYSLWEERVAGTAMANVDCAAAWKYLHRSTSTLPGAVDMAVLRRNLSGPQPPPELCLSEPGWGGPVVGTIHASKGREADLVVLMLPAEQGFDGDDEEARVLFVGATRARERLLVGVAPLAVGHSRLESGRLWRAAKAPAAAIEFGGERDFDAEGLAGKRHFADAAACATAQTRLRDLAGKPVALVARLRRDQGFVWCLEEQNGGPPLAFLSADAARDLGMAAGALSIQRRDGPFGPPDMVTGLWLLGLSTLAIAPDDNSIPLHRPAAEAGLLLAPVVVGFTPSIFPSLRR
jgi:AAA domain/UvrD-like helicase C-terminal domain